MKGIVPYYNGSLMYKYTFRFLLDWYTMQWRIMIFYCFQICMYYLLHNVDISLSIFHGLFDIQKSFLFSLNAKLMIAP